MKSLYTFLVLFSFAAHAQVYPIENPSLEGRAGKETVPSGWLPYQGTPDTEPGGYTTNFRASNGRSYVYMGGGYSDKPDEDHSESIQQLLTIPLKAGKTYKVSFDAVNGPFGQSVITTYATCRLRGISKSGQIQILWDSGEMYNQDWKRFTAVFTTSLEVSTIIVSTYSIFGSHVSPILCIDNFSGIYEIINLVLSSDNACPDDSNGTVSVTIPNADDDYAYLWEPGGYTTPSVKGLPAGVYKITAKSAKGLTTEGEVEVKTSHVSLLANNVPITCLGKRDAGIHVIPAGGQPPYTFSYDNGPPTTDTFFNNLGLGIYDVKVYDKQQCTKDTSYFVYEPPLMVLRNAHTTPIACGSAKNGQIVLTVTGGNPPYTYSIPDVLSQQDSIISQLDAGNYHYIISDDNNCKIEGDAVIDKNTLKCAVYVPTAFSPNGDGKNDVFRVKLQDAVTDYRMAVYDRWGQLVFESHDPLSSWDGSRKDTGTYIWVVTYTDSKKQLMKQQGSVLLIY